MRRRGSRGVDFAPGQDSSAGEAAHAGADDDIVEVLRNLAGLKAVGQQRALGAVWGQVDGGRLGPLVEDANNNRERKHRLDHRFRRNGGRWEC